MKIPKEFKLHGKTIKVVKNPKMFNKDNRDGRSDYIKDIIEIHDYDEKDVSSAYREQVFLHEVIHQILFHMQSEKQHDENFVNLFSELLYQFMETQKF